MRTPSLCPAALAAVIVAAPAFAQPVTHLHVQQSDFVNGNHTINTDSPGGQSGSLSGTFGSTTGSIDFGSGAMAGTASNNPNNASQGGNYNSSGFWTDAITINPANPALVGTNGTVQFTYHLNGSLMVSNNFIGTCSYSFNGPSGLHYDGGYFPAFGTQYTGTPIASLATFTDSVGFTYGTAFQATTSIGAGADTTSSSPGMTGSAAVTLRAGAMTVLDGNNKPVGYTAASVMGNSAATPVNSGGSYAGFGVTNNTQNGHLGSTFSLVGGTASAATTVNATFGAPPATIPAASDAVDVFGTAIDKFALQLTYDPGAAVQKFGSELNVALKWLDPASGNWLDPWAGDSDGGASHQTIFGTYDSGTNYPLGTEIIDTANHLIDFIGDHNSTFVVSGLSPVPEPSSLALLAAAGGVAWVVRRRRRRMNNSAS